MHKNAKTFLNSTIYTYLCKKLGRDWVLGSLAMPRLGPKLGSGEVYVSRSLLLISIANVAVYYDHALGESLAPAVGNVVGKITSCL